MVKVYGSRFLLCVYMSGKLPIMGARRVDWSLTSFFADIFGVCVMYPANRRQKSVKIRALLEPGFSFLNH